MVTVKNVYNSMIYTCGMNTGMSLIDQMKPELNSINVKVLLGGIKPVEEMDLNLEYNILNEELVQMCVKALKEVDETTIISDIIPELKAILLDNGFEKAAFALDTIYIN